MRLLGTLNEIFDVRSSEDEVGSTGGDRTGLDIAEPESAIGREFDRLIGSVGPREHARRFGDNLVGLGLDLEWASGELNSENANVKFRKLD